VCDVAGVDKESGNLLFEVDVCRLCAGRSRNVDYFEHPAVDVVDVWNERAASVCGYAVVARGLRKVITAEQLIEGRSREIHRFEGIVIVQKAVSDARIVDIKAACAAKRVDADYLGHDRAGEIFVLELLRGQLQGESLVFVHIVVAGNFVMVIDTQQLGKGVVGIVNGLKTVGRLGRH
jgi:hypothetical protein